MVRQPRFDVGLPLHESGRIHSYFKIIYDLFLLLYLSRAPEEGAINFLELQSMLGIGQRRLQDVDALFQMLRCQMAVPQGHADVAVSGQRRDFC